MRKKKDSAPNEQPAESPGAGRLNETGDRGACGSAGATCPAGPPRFQPAGDSSISHTIAVMSGKGGVGKSAVTMLLAVALRRSGFEVGILDADITGPSIPKGLGVRGPILVGEEVAIPGESSTGIKVMSMNLILPAEEEAVIWRGPLISSAVGQFYQECDWGNLDYLLVDLPPGTADVPLTVMQSMPLAGIILVTTPQELAGMIVGKAVSMAAKLNVPIIGLIENMSYVTCKCGERVEPFGPSHGEEAAMRMGTTLMGRLPLDHAISELADEGRLEEYEAPEVKNVIANIVKRFSPDERGEEPAGNLNGGSMKVAVVLSEGEVSPHFGKCEEVMIAQVGDSEFSVLELLPAPPHECSALPDLFTQKGVRAVIAGGMGAGAIQNLERAGVRVYAGVQGSPEAALRSLVAGSLPQGAAVCGGGHGDGCAH